MIKQIGRLVAADIGKQIEILDDGERVVMTGGLTSVWHQKAFVTETKLRTQVTLELGTGGTLIHYFDSSTLVRTPA